MKTIFFFATTVILFFAVQASLSAQITATWKGGTPGRANVWECATNWKEGRVPNEFSIVLIPDVSTSTFNYPIIKNEVEILYLQCDSSVRLTVLEGGSLIVLQPINEDYEVQLDHFAQIGCQN